MKIYLFFFLISIYPIFFGGDIISFISIILTTFSTSRHHSNSIFRICFPDVFFIQPIFQTHLAKVRLQLIDKKYRLTLRHTESGRKRSLTENNTTKFAILSFTYCVCCCCWFLNFPLLFLF